MKAHVVFVALRVALITILVWAATPRPTSAGGVVTNCSSDTQFSSLLTGGGTITFNCGTVLIHLSSTKTISADTTIDGGGKITLSGDNARRLFFVSGGVSLTLRNIILTNGFSSTNGGAIYNGSFGGDGGALTLENSTIRDSQAGASGGAIVSTGPLHIINSLLEGNQALNGGALYPRFANAQTTIVGSVLRANHATDTTNGWGGAILAWDGAPITIESSDIYSNSAHYGGGIYNFANSSVTLIASALRGNSGTNGGGGGLHNEGTATLINVTLSGNGAYGGNGGGIDNDNGTATLTNVTLSGNAATVGGGINNFTSSATGSTATLTNVTLSSNSASVGGGIYNASNSATGSTATLTNVTLSGNSASDSGGGIDNDNNSTTTLTNVTLSSNTAGISGGSINQETGGSMTVRNTIVADSPSGGNCGGSVTNAGFNLSSDSSCGFNPVPNLMLGPLADNGGPMLTHMPQPGSPAIDFVASGCPPPATDQRGGDRPVDGDGVGGAACDAGAVEYGAVVSVVYLPIVLK